MFSFVVCVTRSLKLSRQAEYGSYPVMVSPEYRKKVLKPLNDRFCLAEACLLADVVQHLQTEAGHKAFHPRYNLSLIHI